MGRADRAAIEAGTPAETLMGRAGRALARAAIAEAGGRYGRRVAIVCGKGNNGGDGYAAAVALAGEGVAAICLHVGPLEDLRGAARMHHDRWSAMGGRIRPFDRAALEGASVVIDALFGTGFRGGAEGEAAAAIAAVNEAGAPVVAADIPSGVDGATGAVEGRGVSARRTVAMGAQKLGTAVGRGAVLSGIVEVADIGIDVAGMGTAFIPEAADIAAALPPPDLDSHKRSRGSVAVIGGADGMSGAILLAARGAMRAGAGYVTILSTGGVVAAAYVAIPEAVKRTVGDAPVLGADVLERGGDVLEHADAVVLGPGLARGPQQDALVDRSLSELGIPVVVDADALSALAGRLERLRERNAPTVLTPHPAELARLLGISVSEIQADRLSVARRASMELRCVVVLKGFRTIVAGPEGELFVDGEGGPELATAGTGDVLSGVAGALLARGLDPVTAAYAGVFVHGRAGKVAASRAGAGVVAWDVAEALGAASSSLTRGRYAERPR